MNLVRRAEETVCKGEHTYEQTYGERRTLKTERTKIQLKENALPHAVYTARRVPLPMLPKVKEELLTGCSQQVFPSTTTPR